MQAARILKIEELLHRKPKHYQRTKTKSSYRKSHNKKPKNILFDEPLSNLDAALRAEMS